MLPQEMLDRLDELNVFIPNEPDVLARLDMIQERIDLREALHGYTWGAP